MVREYPGGSNSVMFGVFDGHGSDGAKVSKHLVASLPEILVNSDAWKVLIASCRFFVTAHKCIDTMVPQLVY